MKTYTTSQICKSLEILPERLRDWMVRGYVKASFPSPGQGRPAEFTIDDIYAIQLFRVMVEGSLSREKARRYLEEYLKEVNQRNLGLVDRDFPEDFSEAKIYCLSFYRHGDDIYIYITYRHPTYKGPIFPEHDLSHIKFTDGVIWDDVYILNFQKVKEFVDSRME